MFNDLVFSGDIEKKMRLESNRGVSARDAYARSRYNANYSQILGQKHDIDKICEIVLIRILWEFLFWETCIAILIKFNMGNILLFYYILTRKLNSN